MQVLDGEREHRRRQQAWHQQRLETGCREDRRGVGAKSRRAVPAVVADDDRLAAAALVGEPRSQAGRGAADHGAVHPVRAGAQRAAQARRAERQRPAEPVCQLGVVPGCEQGAQFPDGCRVDLVVDPGEHGGVRAAHARAATSSMPKPGEVKPPPTNPSDARGSASAMSSGVLLGVVERFVAQRSCLVQGPGPPGVRRDAPDDRETKVRRAQAGVDEPRAVVRRTTTSTGTAGRVGAAANVPMRTHATRMPYRST